MKCRKSNTDYYYSWCLVNAHDVPCVWCILNHIFLPHNRLEQTRNHQAPGYAAGNGSPAHRKWEIVLGSLVLAVWLYHERLVAPAYSSSLNLSSQGQAGCMYHNAVIFHILSSTAGSLVENFWLLREEANWFLLMTQIIFASSSNLDLDSSFFHMAIADPSALDM